AASALAFALTAAPVHGTSKQGSPTLAVATSIGGSPKALRYSPSDECSGDHSFKFKVTDTGDPAGCSGSLPACDAASSSAVQTVRSEERRVGEESTTRWRPGHQRGVDEKKEHAPATTLALSGHDNEKEAYALA